MIHFVFSVIDVIIDKDQDINALLQDGKSCPKRRMMDSIQW